MERLTEWHYQKKGGAYMKCSEHCEREDCLDCIKFDALVDRLAAYEDTGLTPERIAELAQAERDGRLVVLPGGEDNAVLSAVFREDELPMVMHGGGDTDDLISLTHVLVSYAAETLGVGYTDFCRCLGEMPPITGFKTATEAEAAAERMEGEST